LNGVPEYLARPFEIIAGIEQAINLRTFARPLLDLVEVARRKRVG
jgi:hypothetical protein